LVEQMFPTARVELQVAGPTADVLAALRALPTVSRVEPDATVAVPPWLHSREPPWTTTSAPAISRPGARCPVPAA